MRVRILGKHWNLRLGVPGLANGADIDPPDAPNKQIRIGPDQSAEMVGSWRDRMIAAEAEVAQLREALTSVQERRIDAAVEGSDWKSRALKAEADCAKWSGEWEKHAKQIEQLRQDAARWNYIRLACSQIGSARMDSQHYWRFRQPFGLIGPTIDEAMDNAMRERPILLAAAKETQ